MMHGWQSESTDGRKSGWSCVFRSPRPQLLDVVRCSAAVLVVVA